MVCEYTAASTQDTNSGQDPCGLSACSGFANGGSSGYGSANLSRRSIETPRSKLPQGKELVAYPNPAGDTVHIVFKVTDASKARLILADLSGNAVISKDFRDLRYGENEGNLDINSVASGIYFLILQTDNGFGFNDRATFKIAVVR